jgi:hypothetical protein
MPELKERGWVPTLALVVSIGSMVVMITIGWTTTRNTLDFHETRIGALETWQKETRETLHSMDKKLDRIEAKLTPKP